MIKKRLAVVTDSVAEPPAWFAWLAVAAMFLLPFPALSRMLGGEWLASHLSPGEWLLLPLGVLSITMGLLTLSKLPERTLLPLWIAAFLPGALWLIGICLAMVKNGIGATGGDLLLAWLVRLVFPALAFLPLLPIGKWRDRLFWALAAGVVVNVIAIFLQLSQSEEGRFGAFDFAQAGFFDSQHDYGLYLALALPLIAGWRGGGVRKQRALAMTFCMFLLPALALGVLVSGGLLLAAAAGLTAAWAVWRSHAWILGIFLCLILMGYGSDANKTRDRNQRVLLTATLSPVNTEGGLSLRLASFDAALAVFVDRPFLGIGPDTFFTAFGRDPKQTGTDFDAPPWYAQVLGSAGLIGLCLWFVLIAELIGRAVGRRGKPCMETAGIIGGVVGLIAAGIWTNVLASGGGALVGFMLALSILESGGTEDTVQEGPRRRLASDSIMMRRTRIMERVSGKNKKADDSADKQ